MKDEAPSHVIWEGLLSAALSILERSYSPYSNFPVAAVVIDEQGRQFGGVNVENASYGLTMCAERVAIYSAVAAGAKRIHAVGLLTKSRQRIAPCGACRQVLAEFCDASVPVVTDDGNGALHSWSVGELLPSAFTPLDLLIEE
jgi:cytidine deaminase